uniref:Uncharacterized protein n=1 Tax=Glycine max TaxID=3847 RepID=A0A0R0GY28_SOYBN
MVILFTKNWEDTFWHLVLELQLNMFLISSFHFKNVWINNHAFLIFSLRRDFKAIPSFHTSQRHHMTAYKKKKQIVINFNILASAKHSNSIKNGSKLSKET